MTEIEIQVTKDEKSEEVEFSLEPGYARWIFTAKGSELELEIFADSQCESPMVYP